MKGIGRARIGKNRLDSAIKAIMANPYLSECSVLLCMYLLQTDNHQCPGAHAVLISCLEKGERIDILNPLTGSTSLTSTAASQLKLGIVSSSGFVPLMI